MRSIPPAVISPTLPIEGGRAPGQQAPSWVCWRVRSRRVLDLECHRLTTTNDGQRPSASVICIVERVTTATATATAAAAQVLEASFSYIKLPELRAVPLAILNRLNPVPAAILKQLSDDPELFDTLPAGVQPQVCSRQLRIGNPWDGGCAAGHLHATAQNRRDSCHAPARGSLPNRRL